MVAGTRCLVTVSGHHSHHTFGPGPLSSSIGRLVGRLITCMGRGTKLSFVFVSSTHFTFGIRSKVADLVTVYNPSAVPTERTYNCCNRAVILRYTFRNLNDY